MIEVESPRKPYGEFVAVDEISSQIKPGEIFIMPGPNGAGKSTAGKVRIFGNDVIGAPVAAKRQLDVMPQELALYEDLSATENLNYWGAAYGLGGTERKQRLRETLEFVALVDRAEEPSKRFSGGMKPRISFACGIVHRPLAYAPISRGAIVLGK